MLVDPEFVYIYSNVYKFAITASAIDNPPEVHLTAMCHGLWTRLDYLFTVRRSAKVRSKQRLNLSEKELDMVLSTTHNQSDVAPKRIYSDISVILAKL